jgi:hypothetical protein
MKSRYYRNCDKLIYTVTGLYWRNTKSSKLWRERNRWDTLGDVSLEHGSFAGPEQCSLARVLINYFDDLREIGRSVNYSRQGMRNSYLHVNWGLGSLKFIKIIFQNSAPISLKWGTQCVSITKTNRLTTFSKTLELRILPTQCICVFRMVLTINSDCFPKQH